MSQETPHYYMPPEKVKGKVPNQKLKYDFKDHIVKGDPPKADPNDDPEVDLNDPTTYLNEKYTPKVEDKEGGLNETQLRLAVLNQQLIEGFTEMYDKKNVKYDDLRRIKSDEKSKPWERAAATALLRKRMLQNDV